MSGPLFLAVDLGTSFIKTGLYDAQSICVTTKRQPVQEECLRPGTYIQRADLIFDSVVECIRKTAETAGDLVSQIEAIVFTGQMAGFMGCDSQWNDITFWSCTLDNRYLPFADRMISESADILLETAGTNSPVMAPKIQWFAHDFPKESKTIAKYMMISGYVLGRLGEVPIDDAVIDQTYLEWTGLADINKGQWSDELLNRFGVDREKLPRIVHSATVCGHLAKTMADRCGLKSGIPLVSGAGDKRAGCLGAAVVNPGDTILEAASYGGMSCCLKEYRPDYKNRRLDVIPSAIPGEFYSHYYIAGSGVTLDWYVRNFVAAQTEEEKYRLIEGLAAEVPPGSEGLMALGMLGGCAMPLNSAMRGLWSGFGWSHKAEHFYRALLECYSYEFAITTDTFDELYPEYKGAPVCVIGGGSKSVLWNQIHANVSGRSYQTLSRGDVALWGACIIAGKAIGLYDDMKEIAKQHVSVTGRFETDKDMHDFYRKEMERYKSLLKTSQAGFDQIVR